MIARSPLGVERGIASEEALVSRGLSVLLSLSAVMLMSAAPAVAAPAVTPASTSITATGNGQVRVRPADRHSNSSIAAGFQAARRASFVRALADARQNALDYAHLAGLTLGQELSISDQQTGGGFYAPGMGFSGPFGPGQFCGTLRQPIFKHVKRGRKLIGFKKVHRCIVPPFAFSTLTITYSAS